MQNPLNAERKLSREGKVENTREGRIKQKRGDSQRARDMGEAVSLE